MKSGEYIKKLRKEKKLSQEELGKRIGTGHSVISKYENGQIEPSIAVLNRIADALDIPREEFLYEVFNIELDRFLENDPKAAVIFSQAADSGILDVDFLIKQCEDAIKEKNYEKAIESQTLLKQALSHVYKNLITFHDSQRINSKNKEQNLLSVFDSLNVEGQIIAIDVLKGLSTISKYQKDGGDPRDSGNE